MPGKKRIQVVMELQKTCPSVRINAIPGGARDRVESYPDSAAIAGFAKVFTKPFSVAELMTATNELLVVDKLKSIGK